MNQALLTSLQKQDDDLQVLENTEHGFIVLTSLNIGIPVEDEKEILPQSINIQITRHYFASSALIFFFIPVFGLVPFYLLIKFPLIVSMTLLIASFAFLILLHGILYSLGDESWALFPMFLLSVFNNYIFVVSLAGFGSTFAPFQGCSILFIECTSVILVALIIGRTTKTMDTIWCTLVMMLSGLLVWGVGLYAFIKEQDWISSGLLFGVCVVVYPLLSGLKIYRINRNTFRAGEVLKILCENPLRGACACGSDAADSND